MVSEFPASKRWYNDFYVDDLISGAESADQAKLIRQDVVEMLAKAGFKLRKWVLNMVEALKGIPKEDLAKTDVHVLNVGESMVSTLGVIWEPRTDIMRVRVPSIMLSSSATKRNVMGAIARMYDPLGFVDPVKMVAKIFMQQLWKLKDVNGISWP